MTFRGQKSRSYFDVKYAKNGKSYDVEPMGFTLDDLERLKVKVTNAPVTAIDMWGYTPVRITGVLVLNSCLQRIFIACAKVFDSVQDSTISKVHTA